MAQDVVIGRRGESLTGRVLDKGFTIRTAFGALMVATRRIAWVHFENPPSTPQDEIWLHAGDRLLGKILETSVNFRPEGESARRIPCDAIHTLIITAGLDARAKSLRK